MDYSAGYYVMLFLLAFSITALMTPLISKLAIKTNIIDKPGLHKTHIQAKPLLGGLAIFIAFSSVLFLFLPVDSKLNWLIVGTIVLVITGLYDDIYNINPFIKLTGQFVAAAVVVLGNIDLYDMLIGYLERVSIPSTVTVILIIGWIVLMINAFNLIDGMDGLAVGTAAIIFFATAVLSMIDGGRPNLLGVQLIGTGACLGFLIYNFNPARIFMGDTGSMLLGFILATTHLFTIREPVTGQIILGSMFIFAYPALDVGYAIYRRICCKEPLFKADKGHIHHVLQSIGFSVRSTVLIIYVLNLLFTAMAVILLGLDIPTRILLVLWIITIAFVILLFRKLLLISNRNGLSYVRR